MSIVTIRKGREKSIVNRHPWIFSGGVVRVQGAQAGDIVRVVTERGEFLGQGYFNPASQIQVRLLTWREETIDAKWWQDRLRQAIEGRAPHAEGVRLVHAESDYLPGLIIDRYGAYLVMQALTLTVDRMKVELAQWLVDCCAEAGITIKGVYERSDVDVRRREGLDFSTGVLWGEAPPDIISMTINDVRYLVDVYKGHKTGFYLDQLDNHAFLRDFVAHQDWAETPRLLNAFCYTGGFSVASGIDSVNVDSSGGALADAERLFAANDLNLNEHTFIEADCFEYLRQEARSDRRYDVVIIDPPKFAQNKRQVERASKGYKDINMNALKCVKAGGIMLTFSCSGAVTADLFQKIVFGALVDSGRQGQIIRYLHAGVDHPIALTFPEGAYLKGLVLRVY